MTQQPQMVGQSRPGQMTAVMRAMAQSTGPKVLRIGLVQSGKVIEERVIKQRSHVTVGPSEKSMFVLPTRAVPPNFRLFELVGNDYCLNFLDGMSGRVALKTGISDLMALRGQAKRVAQGSVQAYQIPLSEEARGKVVIGETTFLFQFVAPPPVQPKPQLPLSVKSGVDIDWTTTIIAAFSFLFHFGLIGSIYSDWMDPVVDDNINAAQLIEAVKSLPPPPPAEEKENPDAAATAAEVAAPTAAATAAQQKSQQSTSHAKSGGQQSKVSDTRAAQISSELSSLDVAMLATLNSNGASTDRVLTNSEMATSLLDDAAASNAAAGRAGASGLNLSSGPGFNGRPGDAGGNSLANLGHTGQGEVGPTAGTAKTVKGPTGSVGVGGANVSGGSVANASAVVAGMAAGFRRCYNRGLQENPDMKGTVRITAKIGPNGEVLGASPSGGGSLSGTVISCVAARVASAQFAPPDGGGATIVIPVSFAPQ
jgi:hypothetical protein